MRAEPSYRQVPTAQMSAIIRVMSRLNLTLDADTDARLQRHAKRVGARRATLARDLLREALARREAGERYRKLAADYAAGNRDTRALLRDFEAAQLEVIGDEDD